MSADPPSVSQDEKPLQQHHKPHTELVRHPTIAFSDQIVDQLEIEETYARPYSHFAPRGGERNLEIRRELTQEEKELSRANYDHLETHKDDKDSADADGGGANHTDIREHRYSVEQLQDTFKTNFDIKQAASSFGLTSGEAATRLARDGPNILTPPKKKSALQKASLNILLVDENLIICCL